MIHICVYIVLEHVNKSNFSPYVHGFYSKGKVLLKRPDPLPPVLGMICTQTVGIGSHIVSSKALFTTILRNKLVYPYIEGTVIGVLSGTCKLYNLEFCLRERDRDASSYVLPVWRWQFNPFQPTFDIAVQRTFF